MNPLLLGTLLLVALGATAVVLAQNLVNQAIVLSLYGMALSLLFLVLQAPDVAFSEITVGSAALPLILLVTIAKVEGRQQ